jgi:hypothetical protein
MFAEDRTSHRSKDVFGAICLACGVASGIGMWLNWNRRARLQVIQERNVAGHNSVSFAFCFRRADEDGEVRTRRVVHLSGGRIRIKEERVAKILAWPKPKTQTDVRSFLGNSGHIAVCPWSTVEGRNRPTCTVLVRRLCPR